MSSCADKKYKLIYFNGRGKAEAIRYILHYANVIFEDFRMPLGSEEWPKIKATMPVGQVPVLEITEADGKVNQLCQSATIVRQLANWFGLAGKKPCEIAAADEVYECIRDIADAGGKAWWEKDEALKKKFLEQLTTDVVPRNLTHIEKKIQANGGKNIAGGDSFTYVDLALAQLLDSMQRLGNVDWSTVESKFPGCVAVKKAVEETPGIKAYLAVRPETAI